MGRLRRFHNGGLAECGSGDGEGQDAKLMP